MSQFLSNLPIGAKVKFGKYSVEGETALPIIWLVADKKTPSAITLLTEKIIDFRYFDAPEESNTNSARASYGNNRYSVSNIDQWLNKDQGSGAWYVAQHSVDSPPTFGEAPYKNRPGFLNAFSDIEKDAILNSTIGACIPTLDGGGYENIVRKVFLPSAIEMGLSYGKHTEEGQAWGLGLDAPKTSEQAYAHTKLTGNKPNSPDAYSAWWTRTPITDTANYVALANRNNSAFQNTPTTQNVGIRPALNLSSTQKVSDVTDSDGCYTVVWNDPPLIDGKDENIGIKSTGFGGNYTITDANNDIVTVTEAIDGIRIRTLVATLGERIYYDVTDNTWLALPNGSHTLTISATDGIDTTVRTIVFTKLVDTFKIQNTTPWVSSTMPSRIMLVITRNIPPAATFKVEVCNNGYDSSPTWEDCSDAVASGMAYMFTNKTKTATDWGVLVRVTVARNGAAGACYVSSIGGNFE